MEFSVSRRTPRLAVLPRATASIARAAKPNDGDEAADVVVLLLSFEAVLPAEGSGRIVPQLVYFSSSSFSRG